MQCTKYLMNPQTGSVDTADNWQAEFIAMNDPKMWGGNTYDSNLIEVKLVNGDWVEVN